MLFKVIRPANEVKFDFYTYDPTGRDIVLPVWAIDEDAAWDKFDRIYGKDMIVDQVIRGAKDNT